MHGVSWAEEISNALEARGYRVSRVVERFRNLEGSIVERVKVLGFSSDGRVKISIVGLEKGLRLMITVSGEPKDLRSLAEDAEALGGSVEVEEDARRLYIVFNRVDAVRAGALIEGLL